MYLKKSIFNRKKVDTIFTSKKFKKSSFCNFEFEISSNFFYLIDNSIAICWKCCREIDLFASSEYQESSHYCNGHICTSLRSHFTKQWAYHYKIFSISLWLSSRQLKSIPWTLVLLKNTDEYVWSRTIQSYSNISMGRSTMSP